MKPIAALVILILATGCKTIPLPGHSKAKGWHFGPWQSKPPVEEPLPDQWDVPPLPK